MDSIVRTGAELFIFTTAHALQMMPAPHPVIDRIAPGRTCRRDLIAELTDALGEKGIPLILYYNHSCNSGQDAAWEKAAGYHDADKTRFAQNIIDIVGHMGDRYKEKAKAWWFDSPYSLDPRGPVNSVTTDMKGFQFPWEKLTTAAKLGFAGRLVTYNAGVDRSFLYTDRQDYYAGETNGLKSPATNRYLDSGLQNFRWTTLNGVEWVHTKPDTDQPPPRHSDEQVAAYIRACNAHQCPAAFNLGVDQEGIIDAASVEQMRRVDGLLKA